MLATRTTGYSSIFIWIMYRWFLVWQTAVWFIPSIVAFRIMYRIIILAAFVEWLRTITLDTPTLIYVVALTIIQTSSVNAASTLIWLFTMLALVKTAISIVFAAFASLFLLFDIIIFILNNNAVYVLFYRLAGPARPVRFASRIFYIIIIMDWIGVIFYIFVRSPFLNWILGLI